jgi:putative Holliday junction resolvase
MSNVTGDGRVLGVDLGIKRTGLAVSDELRLTTRALDNLTPRSRAEDVEHLRALCAELEVRDVVVGHPTLPRSGDEGGMARRARGFADALATAVEPLGVRVHLVDERYTSKEAAERLAASGVKRSKRKAALDSEVARLLVERFVAESRGAPG